MYFAGHCRYPGWLAHRPNNPLPCYMLRLPEFAEALPLLGQWFRLLSHHARPLLRRHRGLHGWTFGRWKQDQWRKNHQSHYFYQVSWYNNGGRGSIRSFLILSHIFLCSHMFLQILCTEAEKNKYFHKMFTLYALSLFIHFFNESTFYLLFFMVRLDDNTGAICDGSMSHIDIATRWIQLNHTNWCLRPLRDIKLRDICILMNNEFL